MRRKDEMRCWLLYPPESFQMYIIPKYPSVGMSDLQFGRRDMHP